MALTGIQPRLCHWASTYIAVKWFRDLCLAHLGIRIYRFFKLVSKAHRLLSLSIKNPKLQTQTTDDEWLLQATEEGGIVAWIFKKILIFIPIFNYMHTWFGREGICT